MLKPFSRLWRVAAVAFLALTAASTPALAAAPPNFLGDEAVMGNPNAKVTVIEYGSASCPHCAWFNNAVFPLFKAKYVDTGKVRYVFRELLTDPVAFAAAGFLLARCAGEDRYFTVLDAVYHDQTKIYESGDLKAGIYAIGARFDLPKDVVDACIEDKAAQAALGDRLKKADAAGIHSTPTFLINGTKKEGEMSLGDLDAVIGPMLAK